jgi:hypothetical protein
VIGTGVDEQRTEVQVASVRLFCGGRWTRLPWQGQPAPAPGRGELATFDQSARLCPSNPDRFSGGWGFWPGCEGCDAAFDEHWKSDEPDDLRFMRKPPL